MPRRSPSPSRRPPPTSTLRFDVIDWELPSLRGDDVKLSDYAARSWCSTSGVCGGAPCLRWLPRYLEIEKQFGGRNDVVFLTVNHELRGTLEEQRERVTRFLDYRKWAFPVIMDTDSVAVRTHGVYAFPTTLIIDGYGRVRYANTSINAHAESTLVAEIEALLPPTSKGKAAR